MPNSFIEIGDLDSLERFLAQANASPVLILKHSNTCGVSSRAYAEMSSLDRPVGLLTVQNARDVSDEIEKRWNIAHETPQVLIIREGKLVWDASHFRIRAEAVEAALLEISGQ